MDGGVLQGVVDVGQKIGDDLPLEMTGIGAVGLSSGEGWRLRGFRPAD
jgi:hypothetical protein